MKERFNLSIKPFRRVFDYMSSTVMNRTTFFVGHLDVPWFPNFLASKITCK